jgi:carbonic anhydrase
MRTLDHLFERNRAWAAAMLENNPSFFASLVAQQTPKYLWIGCSDSRVPANEIVGLGPGELFVHRNVANLVVPGDLNCLSVLQYAVDVLRVEHVIVCGHYGCGGVRAAYERASLGLVDRWIRHIRDVLEQYEDQLPAEADDETRLRRLCELNVVEQVRHVQDTTIARDAWERRQPLWVHGWIYDLRDGLLRDLGCTVGGAGEADEATVAPPRVRAPRKRPGHRGALKTGAARPR